MMKIVFKDSPKWMQLSGLGLGVALIAVLSGAPLRLLEGRIGTAAAQQAAAPTLDGPTVDALLMRMDQVLDAVQEQQARQQESPLLELEVDALRRRILRLEEELEVLKKSLGGQQR